MTTAVAAPAPRAPTPAPARPGWLYSRLTDGILVANWWWPLMALGFAGGGWLRSGLSWWQLYLLSSPHRWITLPLAFGDLSRVRVEWRRFLGVGLGLTALGVLLLGVGLRSSSGMAALGLLLAVDYVWNAWHFASQGAGVSRIYGRAVAPATSVRQAETDKTLMRVVVIWSFIRLAIVSGVTSAQTRIDVDLTSLDRLTRLLDPVVVVVAAVAVMRVARRSSPGHRSQVSYTASLMALYGLLLVALFARRPDLAGYLAFAGAVFHATEYLAVCRWAAARTRTGLWQRPAARSTSALAAFIVVVGGFNWAVAAWSPWAWAVMTLMVSLLHYGYDGMIWRSSPKRQMALAGAGSGQPR